MGKNLHFKKLSEKPKQVAKENGCYRKKRDTVEEEFKMNNLRKSSKNERTQRIKDELTKLKAFKAKCSQRMTVATLKGMKGFEDLSDELAEKVISQLEEYARIIIRQMNRLTGIKNNEYEG